jgi:signal transduction histidine kinase
VRRRLLRVAVGLAVVILALLDVQGLVQTLRSEARLRTRVIRATREATSAALPRLAAMLAAGGDRAYAEAAQEAIRSSLASEFEVFNMRGGRLFASPAVAPVRHWPTAADLAAIGTGQVLTVGPVSGESSRLLSYVSLRSGGSPVVARLATPVPDLAEDLGERRELLVGHALSLLILVVAGGLALFPASAADSPRGALDAYEEAMRRLRERSLAVDKEHEQERLRLTHDLEDREAMARAGELTAGIAHEVRNGLGTILGYARLLERSGAEGEVGDSAQQIREECETLESVVRRFMDFVKRETLAPAAFDLEKMLNRVVARESRSRSGATAAVQGAFGVLVGDEELLERAFENVVRNALEAAGKGGHVVVEGRRNGATQSVLVRDDGPGMSPEVLQSLRPFYTTKAGGLGLGLAIAFKVVGLHRGEILLGPGLPRGLVVTVSLPAEPKGPSDVTDRIGTALS